MSRYTQLPVTLYRIQSKLPVRLRDYEVQKSKGLTSYDLKLKNGLVHPMPISSPFVSPNGMSLRPMGTNLESLVRGFKNDFTIYTLCCGIQLPPELCVFHEHSDHYSLQTTKPVTLDTFNQILTEFLMSQPKQTKEQFINQLNDPDDYDM
jgi:hypothetical protein